MHRYRVSESLSAECQILGNRRPRLGQAVPSSYLAVRQIRSTNTSSRQAPLSSMLEAIFTSSSTLVKLRLVNKAALLGWKSRACRAFQRLLEQGADGKADASSAAIAPKETKNAHALPKPAKPEFENRQLDLFQRFLCNTDDQHEQLSNAIDLWDSVPRYSVSRQAMTKARIGGQFLKKHSAMFQHRGRMYTRIIYPARVTDLDGQERDYYPSATEELVEHALRKLAIEQQAGYFHKPNYRSSVVFTLYALREEMKKRGHARSYQQLVQALNILSHCVIDIIPLGEGEAQVTSACLASLAAVSRTQLRDDPKAKWAVQFHPLVTGSIDQVTYRQFNYHLMMSHSTQLTRCQ